MTEEDTDENVNERINPVSLSKPEDVEEIEKIGDRTESVQSNEEIVTEEPWISSILFFFTCENPFFFSCMRVFDACEKNAADAG